MGDNEFEKFLEGKEGGEGIPICQKRLVFDIVKQKMDNTRDLLDIFTKLRADDPEAYKGYIDSLYKIATVTQDQMDYILSLVLEEINEGLENEEEEP